MRKDRSYRCYYYTGRNIPEKGTNKRPHKLVKVGNDACWAGMRGNLHVPYIFIAEFRVPETEEIIPKLIALINTFTECKVIKRGKEEYIRYKPLSNKSYRHNLIVLNFIRTLWYMQGRFNTKKFVQEVHKIELDSLSDRYDAFYKLLSAYKKSIRPKIKTQKMVYTNHDNVVNNIKIKNFKKFMSIGWEKNTTDSILRQ